MACRAGRGSREAAGRAAATRCPARGGPAELPCWELHARPKHQLQRCHLPEGNTHRSAPDISWKTCSAFHAFGWGPKAPVPAPVHGGMSSATHGLVFVPLSRISTGAIPRITPCAWTRLSGTWGGLLGVSWAGPGVGLGDPCWVPSNSGHSVTLISITVRESLPDELPLSCHNILLQLQPQGCIDTFPR